MNSDTLSLQNGYPDEAFASPAVEHWPHFRTLVGCTIDTIVWQRKEIYKQVSMRLEGLPNDPHTEWRFELAKEALPAVNIDGRCIRRMPTMVSFMATNQGSETMHLHLGFDEWSWEPVATFTGKRHHITQPIDLKPGESRLCEYDMRLTGDPSTGKPSTPVFPLGRMLIMSAGAVVGKPYHLVLRDLQVHYPQASGLIATSFVADAKAKAGDPWKMKLRIDGLWPDELAVEWRLGSYTNWRVILDKLQISALKSAGEISLNVPNYMLQGQYDVVVCAGGYHVSGGSTPVELRNLRKPGFAQMEVKQHLGRNLPFRNGQPIHWQGWASYDFQPGPVRQFGRRGHKLFIVPVSAGQHIHHQVATATNPLPGEYDFGQLHERVSFCLQTSRETVVMLRVSLTPPPFWTQQHESERAIAEKNGELMPWEETGTEAISLASQEWIKYQTDMLKRLIDECQKAPWADRLVGVFLSAEVTEEWFAWGCNDDALADYSTPFNRAWNQWKTRERRTDLPNTLASPDMRRAGKELIQPDSADGRWCSATAQFLSDITAQVILYFCKQAKLMSQRQLLVTVLYGYLIQLAGEPRQSTSGHFGVRAILDSKDVDIIAGVPLLSSRDYIRGSVTTGEAEGSIALAGKIHMMENDLFSFLHPGLWHTLYNAENPRLGAIDMHQRVSATVATEGYLEQKFSLACSWHHDKALLDEFGRLAKVNLQALSLNRSSEAEVAMLVDDRSMSLNTLSSSWMWGAHRVMVHTLATTGAPFEVYLLSDAARLPDRIKYVVVASGIGATDQSLSALTKLLKRGRMHVLAVGPLGLVNARNGKWLRDRPADLLGLPIVINEKLDLSGSASSMDCEVKIGGSLLPRSEVKEPGEWKYSDGQYASAVRPLPNGGKLLWVGIPPCDGQWLRSQLKTAGVTLYAPEGFAVHASRQLLAVTANVAGDAEIILKRPAQVVDLYGGWKGSGEKLTVPFRAGQTRLFKLG
ncbi:MAG: hypothetical protein ACYC1M_06050 [Armatimonadota bacterium]